MNVCSASIRKCAGFMLWCAASMSVAAPVAAAGEVNVYSYRQPFLVEPVFERFTEQTGIRVNLVFSKSGLVERLRNEGRNSPADLLLTSSTGSLIDALNADLLRPLQDEILETNIPAKYRDSDGRWFGLTTRARIIVTSKERMADDEILSYQDLADEDHEGRVCTRSGKHGYMLGLIASVIAHRGEPDARQWLSGVKRNLARKPQGNDRGQVKAISEGQCDIAVINSYYMGAMLANPEQVPWAESVRIVFPNQDSTGTHMNISGVGLTHSSPNRENAIRLMQYLSDEEAQKYYADVNAEYPVNPAVSPSELVASWGEFNGDEMPLDEISRYRVAASKLVDEVGYDH